jgi:hypothetical protein
MIEDPSDSPDAVIYLRSYPYSMGLSRTNVFGRKIYSTDFSCRLYSFKTGESLYSYNVQPTLQIDPWMRQIVHSGHRRGGVTLGMGLSPVNIFGVQTLEGHFHQFLCVPPCVFFSAK